MKSVIALLLMKSVIAQSDSNNCGRNSCADGFQLNADCTFCERIPTQDVCPSTYLRDINGICAQTCGTITAGGMPPGNYMCVDFEGQAQRMMVINPVNPCPPDASLAADGSCVCPVFTKLQDGGTRCGPDLCEINQTLQQDGSCLLQCPVTYVQVGGNCQCPNYTRVQQDGTCAADPCQGAQVLQPDGTCFAPACNPDRDLIGADGSCITCDLWTKPQSDGTCRADNCARNQVLQMDGHCLTCPSDQPFANKRGGLQNQICEQRPACNQRQEYDEINNVCTPCDQYEKRQFDAASGNDFCGPDQCDFRSKLNPNGTCSSCPNYYQLNGKYQCEPTKCPLSGDSVIQRDGSVGKCPPGQMADPTCRSCVDRPVVKPPTNGGKRISLVSIAPLDRLLSQATQRDEITVRVRCEVPYPGQEGLDNDYDFTFEIDDVNTKTCLTSAVEGQRDKGGDCDLSKIIDSLDCPPYRGYTIELFKREKPSNRRRLEDQIRQELNVPAVVTCTPPLVLNQDKTACEAPPDVRCPPGPIAPMHTRFADGSCNCPMGLEEIKLATPVGQQQYSCCPAGQSPNSRNPRQCDCPEGTQKDGSGNCIPIEPVKAQFKSIGFFKVTWPMLRCMDQDNLQVHFQYGKRAALTGATACFNHMPYVMQDNDPETQRPDETGQIQPQVEDMIPFTPLNICHKTDTTQKRCYQFGYQVAIRVVDLSEPKMLEMRPYAKISYNGMNRRMLILPGDRVGIRFGSAETPYEAIRMQPDIHSDQLPEPFKSRYTARDGGIRLPCNDVMIADSMVCENTIIYCTEGSEELKFSVQGAGEIFSFDQKCSDFLKGFNWEQETKDLQSNSQNFDNKWKGQQINVDQISYTNSIGKTFTGSDDFEFTYEIGWRIVANDVYDGMCYASDTFDYPQPKCDLECRSKQCELMPLDPPNDKRMLQTAGPDITEPQYNGATNGETQAIAIPTMQLNLQRENIPDNLLEIYLNNFFRSTGQRTDGGLAAVGTVIEETVEEQGEAESINLSAAFSPSDSMVYKYNVKDLNTIVNSPPSYVKITQVPAHGSIKVQQMGEWVVLRRGDMIDAKLLKNFIYDQEGKTCNVSDQSRCTDEFKYIPYGRWTGSGQYQTTEIKLTPVVREHAMNVDAVTGKISSDEPIQLQKEQAPVKVETASETCSDNSTMIVVLSILAVSLLVPMGVLVTKIKNIKSKASHTEMSQFESTQSKQTLKLQVEASEEAAIQNNGQAPQAEV